MASGDTKTESYLRAAAEGTRADLPTDTCCNTKTQNLILGVANRIMDVEDEVEELKNNPDVVDIVDTYADLQSYDTSTLTDKDIIRVLADETHNGNSTYYRFTKNPDTWTFIGEVSGGDTVYSDKTTSSNSTSGAVYIGNLDATQTEQPDPTTIDRNWKYFCALPYTNSVLPQNRSVNILGDLGSNAYDSIVIGGGNIASAKAWGPRSVAIGSDANAGQSSVAIGQYANAGQTGSNISGMVAIGNSANAAVDKGTAVGASGGSSYGILNSNSIASVVIGYSATIGDSLHGYKNAVALGAYSKATRQGEVNVGLVMDETTGGYNNTAYRVIGGVHDPVDAHDAATKGYVDANASTATFYMSVTPFANRSGVSLYSDIALTTAVPASTFVQALRDCKSVFLVYKSGDLDWSDRQIVQIIGSYMPNVDTAEAYDEVFPAGYYFDGSTGDRYMIQSAASDPDDTASFRIVRHT